MPNGGVDLHHEHPRPPKREPYPLARDSSARVSNVLVHQWPSLSPPYTALGYRTPNQAEM